METTKINLVNYCYVSTILGLPCVLPMLEFVYVLMNLCD
jgi:hypothetical protein